MIGNAVASGEPQRKISFHPTEGGAILFDAARRRLYALNPAAGLTWLCIRDGLSQPETVSAIAEGLGIDRALAADWYCASADMFREQHLLDQDVTEASPEFTANKVQFLARPEMSGDRQYFAIFDQKICVHAPCSLHAGIDSLLGLRRTKPPEQVADLPSQITINVVATDREQWKIVVDDYVEAVCDTSSVIAELERVIVEAVVPATPHVLTFHAASLQCRGRTVLLAGSSGSGKTTLSVALSHAGWAFGGDEIVLMEPGTKFQPLPLPPCIKEECFALVSSWFPILRDVPAHQRYGRTIKFLPIQFNRFEACPVVVVFPTFQKGATGSITRIGCFEGLQRLLAQCVFVPSAFALSDVHELLRFHENVEYHDVIYGSHERAMDLLEDALFLSN